MTQNLPSRKSRLFGGLDLAQIHELGERLHGFWERFRSCFHTKTRDTSNYALPYLEGLLRMETERHFTHIGEVGQIPPQNIQHFMSNSPWSSDMLLSQVRQETRDVPVLSTGSALILDESADQANSRHKAGAGRQWNGRLGKVEMSQGGVFLALAHPQANFWTWLDGKLYLPADWFTEAYPLRTHFRPQNRAWVADAPVVSAGTYPF